MKQKQQSLIHEDVEDFFMTPDIYDVFHTIPLDYW